jgi:hypothetical protein
MMEGKMAKKAKAKSLKVKAKVKKGTKFVCDSCGVVVAVDKACECDPCDIACCGQNMRLVSCC